MSASAPQRIVKIRRDYNTWVANETLEDYALRFTPVSFRKWSEFRVANTALGAVSFLALEAIGGALALNYGFINAFWAIIAVALVTFLTGLPIAYYAARHGLDMDLLTRGAGFGYIGSTITSLIYASFTFIFFALEAAIMALAIELATGLPLSIGYLLCAVVILPMVAYGITFISRLQSWTQPIWLVLLLLPYAFVAFRDPGTLQEFLRFPGHDGRGGGFNLLMFGSAVAVAASLVTQIGEQVDFLRFLPERTAANRRRWWLALVCAGPGWILPGAAKILGGAFLAWVGLARGGVRQGVAKVWGGAFWSWLALSWVTPADKAGDPTHMYLAAYTYVVSDPGLALALVTAFVVVSQVKINVTNAYAGSLAWSNFFARITHSHPGRVVWLVFNVLIAVVLMEMGVFGALEHVLAVFSHVALAWIGALVADLVINKPLGLSPKRIEFRRAYLYDINPVGVGSMLIAMTLGLLAFAGVFPGTAGALAQALSPFVALLAAFVCAPVIAWRTRGRYNLARKPVDVAGSDHVCVICANRFEQPDMAHCPAYNGPICSLCCTLDARCQDRCKQQGRLKDQVRAVLGRLLPARVTPLLHSRLGHYLLIVAGMGTLLAGILGLIYYQEYASHIRAGLDPAGLRPTFLKLYAALLLIGGVLAWWLVLAHESRRVAQEESDRQTHLLLREIEAHKQTDAQLQQAKEAAESANLAKSRFMGGLSHELRAPLNSMMGYAQILQRDPGLPPARREAIDVIHRSGKHLIGLIDGLLDIARIEAGRLRLENSELRLPEFLEQIVQMFRPQSALKGLAFRYEATELPSIVHIDEKRLRQILINLLSNALKFTSAGQVSMRVKSAADMVLFEVQDSGRGIPAEDLERIFLPFERSWAAAEEAESGTGLGLTICRMLTGIMGGELTVRSAVGRGSVFTLKLFLPEVRSPRSDARPSGLVVGYRGERLRILTVDDQPSQRRLVRDLLEPLGFEVHEAPHGAACLACVHTLRPALILMDVSMPEMTGWEALRRLRDEGVAVPIVMLSANILGLDPKDPTQSGHDAFIAKPVIYEDLLSQLGRLLRLDWQVAQVEAALPAGDLHRVALEREDAEALLELGAMGYIKGIQAKLEEIQGRRAEARDLTAHLRMLAGEFQLSEFNQVLKHHVQRHHAHAR